MSYNWCLIDNAFFVCWEKLTIPGLDKVLRDMANARRVVGKPLIYVSVTPASHKVPSAAERTALSDFASKSWEFCGEGFLVFEGDGIGHSIQRTAITSVLFLLQRGKSMPTTITKTLDEALKNIAPKLEKTADELMRLLKARGVLDVQK